MFQVLPCLRAPVYLFFLSLLSLTILMLGGLNTAFAEDAHHQSRQSIKPQLYASLATRQALGNLAAELPALAGRDVLALTQDDLHSFMRDAAAHNIETLDRAFANFLAAEKLHDFPWSAQAIKGGAGRQRNYIQKKLLWAVYHGTPSGYPLPPADGHKERAACVIVVPATSLSGPSYFISKLSGIDGVYAQNLPEAEMLWRHFVIAHEAAHCRHSFDDQSALAALAFEREADQAGLAYLRHAYGPDKAQAVIEAIWGLRGVLALRGQTRFHATSAGLTIPGYGDAASMDAQILLNARQSARKAISHFARTGDVLDKAAPDERPVLLAAAAHGGFIAPRRFYQAARTLRDRGYFAATPVQERYVTAFLFGAERYFPSYFGITEE